MTHVNAFKMDVEEAYKKAVAAVSQFKTEVDQLVEKLEADASEETAKEPVVEPAVQAPAEPVKPETATGPGADQSTKTK